MCNARVAVIVVFFRPPNCAVHERHVQICWKKTSRPNLCLLGTIARCTSAMSKFAGKKLLAQTSVCWVYGNLGSWLLWRFHFGGYRWVLTGTSGYWWVLVGTGGYRRVLVCTGGFWWVLVCTGGYWWVLVVKMASMSLTTGRDCSFV